MHHQRTVAFTWAIQALCDTADTFIGFKVGTTCYLPGVPPSYKSPATLIIIPYFFYLRQQFLAGSCSTIYILFLMIFTITFKIKPTNLQHLSSVKLTQGDTHDGEGDVSL